MTILSLSPNQTELAIILLLANLLISVVVGLVLYLAIQRAGDQRALAEHERWKNYLNAEYTRILGESEVNQQEIQALVEEMRGIATLLRDADLASLLAKT